MPLSQNVDLAVTGGDYRRLPSEINANPFDGSLLSYAAADGQVHELVAGEPFAGVCRMRIPSADAATADGSRFIEATGGTFNITATISGVGQDDVVHRRKVFASDDGTLTFTALGNTEIGVVVGVDAAGRAIVLCTTADKKFGISGVETLADAAATLTTSQLDKVLQMTPTAGRTLTLPAAADCAGRTVTVVTLAAFAITLDGNGAELVNGSATFAGGATAGSVVRAISTGAAWVSF